MLTKKIINTLDQRWDYYYLDRQLKKNNVKANNVETLISGSSYGIFGIEPVMNSINLSLPSQDIYYSCKLVKKALDNNKKINKVLLCIGYYTVYCDLSKSSENWRVDEVYYPLLKNRHHQEIDGITKKKWYIKFMETILKKVINAILHVFFMVKQQYFDQVLHTRKRRRFVVWEDVKSTWIQLDQIKKDEAAKKRVSMHEKQLKHSESKKENLLELKLLYEECHMRNIKLDIFIFPFTKEYINNMSETFRQDSLFVIEQLKKYCDNITDFNKSLNLNAIDFVDCDHLSDLGAKKMTEIVNSWIKENEKNRIF